MKKIGIDARLYFQTGVGVYIRNLLFYLQQISQPSNQFEYYIYVLAEDSEKISFDHPHFHMKIVSERWHTIHEQTTFLYRLYQDNLDLMHFTYFSYPIGYKRPFIATVHDLTPLLFKTGKASTKSKIWYQLKYLAFKKVLTTQIHRAKLLITPTEFVKQQIDELFGLSVAAKTHAIYEGVDHVLAATAPNLALKQQFTQPFFVYIGNFYPHKNVERLVEAFVQAKSAFQLVLVGPQNYFSDKLKQLIIKLNALNKIIFYHNASTADLVFFYKNALALVNPSISEGFGLPIVEAVYFNTPVIASNIPVFQELLKEDYISFDPYTINSITHAFKQISYYSLPNPTHYQQLNAKFSFKTMTDQIYQHYCHILHDI